MNVPRGQAARSDRPTTIAGSARWRRRRTLAMARPPPAASREAITTRGHGPVCLARRHDDAGHTGPVCGAKRHHDAGHTAACRSRERGAKRRSTEAEGAAPPRPSPQSERQRRGGERRGSPREPRRRDGAAWPPKESGVAEHQLGDSGSQSGRTCAHMTCATRPSLSFARRAAPRAFRMRSPTGKCVA
jgi:hypothetical protein